MLTFERTRDAGLIKSLIRRAWDRPEMLCDGADLNNVPVLETAQYFVGYRFRYPVALFVGCQQSPVCIDLHCCLAPECRGWAAIEAVKAFASWLTANSTYRKAIGSIPAYNRPMLYVAKAAGFTVMAVNEKSTMRNGKPEDQIMIERRLA